MGRRSSLAKNIFVKTSLLSRLDGSQRFSLPLNRVQIPKNRKRNAEVRPAKRGQAGLLHVRYAASLARYRPRLHRTKIAVTPDAFASYERVKLATVAGSSLRRRVRSCELLAIHAP